MVSKTYNPQYFLNLLEDDEISDFETALYECGGYRKLVNRRHVSSSLNLDQLSTMKSLRTQDGPFLIKWMQCYIQEHHLNQPPVNYPHATLRLDANVWPKSVQDRYNKSSSAAHVKKKGNQGSHLCDTVGCLSKNHLCIETQEINYQRKRCKGIKLLIQENVNGEFLILQVNPCLHGLQHDKANGDFFKYSCRKIQASFINDDDFP